MNRTVAAGSDIAGRRARLWLLALVLAVPGLLRDVSVFFWKAGPLRTTRVDDRYAGLILPAGERAGFLTDVAGGDAQRRYYEALYALAPNLLLQGPDARLVVADVQDPGQIEAICARWRLHVVRRASLGTALLEKD